MIVFFFKQKTAYDIGLGIPAEPLFRSPLPALTVKLSKYNVDDVALGVCKTGAEEAGVTEVRTSLSEKKYAVSDKLLDLVGLGGKSAADKGKDTRDYLAAAFPELNAWERAGADASSAGMVDAGFENQKELTKMQLDNQKE